MSMIIKTSGHTPGSLNNQNQNQNQYNKRDENQSIHALKYLCSKISIYFVSMFIGLVIIPALNILMTADISIIIVSAFRGVVAGMIAGIGGIIWRYHSTSENNLQSNNSLFRDWVEAIICGSIVGVTITFLLVSIFGSGGWGPPDDFWLQVFTLAFIIFLGAIIGALIITFIGAGIRVLGVGVARELAEKYGEELSERWVGWDKNSTEHSRHILISGIVMGMISGAVTFHFNTLIGNDFLWQVSVEVFGHLIALIGGFPIFYIILKIIEDPKEFFLRIGQLLASVFRFVFNLAMIILLFALLVFVIDRCGCSGPSGPDIGPVVPFRP